MIKKKYDNIYIYFFKQINTTHDSEDVKELSCIVSPNSHFNNPSAKTENEEHKVNLFYCDTCEKGTFATEVELMNHKKIYHLKVTSPGKVLYSKKIKCYHCCIFIKYLRIISYLYCCS